MTPPTRTVTNYITQEAVNSISIPTHNSTTQLNHFCAPVIQPITGESITNYKIGKISSNKGSLEYSIWKGMGKPCAKMYKNRNKREKLTICRRSKQNLTDTFRPHFHICKHYCILTPTKDRPQPLQDHFRRQPHKLPRVPHDKNGVSNNIKNIM